VLDYFDVRKARVMRVINPKSKELVVTIKFAYRAKRNSNPALPSFARQTFWYSRFVGATL